MKNVINKVTEYSGEQNIKTIHMNIELGDMYMQLDNTVSAYAQYQNALENLEKMPCHNTKIHTYLTEKIDIINKIISTNKSNPGHNFDRDLFLIHRFSYILLNSTSRNLPYFPYLERPDFTVSEQVIKRTLADIQVLHNLFKLHNLIVFCHNITSGIYIYFWLLITDML